MPGKLRVYGWQWYHGGPKTLRIVLATTSKAACLRAVRAVRPGTVPSALFNLEETGNAKEIEMAMARPGVMFAKDVTKHGDPFEVWPAQAVESA